MATISSRRRRDRSLGQIPLSSSEIELYSHQDEVTRRRRRLLAVRDEERRLAQQMTLHYRNNLQKLQHKKLQTFQKELSSEQQKMLKDLHGQYQNPLQGKGTTQRNARLKLLEFMQQAQKEKNKRTLKCQIAGKGDKVEAQESQEKEAVVTTARRRQVEQKREGLKGVNNQQGRRTSARALQEDGVARERVRDREELETLRKMQSSDEVVMTPRRRQNDGVLHRGTRSHCDLRMPGMEKPAVTVIRHNGTHLTARRGKDEAVMNRDEIDHKREVDRSIVEAQQKKGLERGRKALDEVVSRRKGLQAMEWLALLDKMERQARGQKLGGGEDYSLHAGDVNGGMDKSERMAERAFAQMLGLNGDSIELSIFSINSDDEQSVAVADPDHELVDDDEAAREDSGYRVKLKRTKRSDSFDSRDRSESVGPVTSCKGEQAEHRPGKPLKTTSSFGDMHREKVERLENPEDMRKTDLRLEGIGTPSKARSEARDSEYEDQLDMSTRLSDVIHEKTCSCESHFSIVAVDDEHKESILKVRLQDLGDERPKSDFSAGRSSGESLIENMHSQNHSENECFEVMAVERTVLDSTVSSIPRMEESNTGQLGDSRGDRALLETPFLEKKWCTTRGDHYISNATEHRHKIRNTEVQSGGTNEVGENRSALDRSNTSLQSLARDEVDQKKMLEVAPNLGRLVSTTGSVETSFVEGAEFLSASSSTNDAGNHEFYEKSRDFDRTNSCNVVIDDDERLSISDSFSAPIQKSLSQLDQVANGRIRSLKQLCVDQQMMSSLDSEGLSEDEEGEAESHRPSIDINNERSSVNFTPRNPYCQQIHYEARRSSASAVSVAQYSLSSSDTHNSFDDCLEGLCPGHDDSFVNELVPMFPKHTLPPPPRSLEEDNQVFEEYDIQLVAPNMSRMLTSEQLPSFRSREQRLIYEKHQAAATDHLCRQPPASTIMQAEGKHPSTLSDKSALSSSFSRRSYLDFSSCKLDGKSVNTSVGQSRAQQHKATRQIRQVTTVATGSKSRQLPGNSQPPTGDCKERDALSDISSESNFSSLGWSVELDIAAVTARRRGTVDNGRVTRNSVDSWHNHHAQEYPSDDEVDKRSIASVRSFASSSSMSMDAYFNYIIAMTSTVGKSLPLPTVMYDKNDMTKRPEPMTWSTSSVSSVTTASKMDQSNDSVTSSITAEKSVASSDLNDSLLEMQQVHPRRFGMTYHLARDRDLQHSVSYQSEESDASRASERIREARSGEGLRWTCSGSDGEITELRLYSLSSRNMSQPLTPMQNLSWSFDDSGSSDGQSTDDIQRHHVLPPPLGPITTHQLAAPMQRFGQSLDDFQSSSEQNFRDRSVQRRDVRRRPYHHSYDAEEESKQDDSSSESGVSSHTNASCGSSAARSCYQSMQKAENMEIPIKKLHSEHAGDRDGKELSLAEAFQQRHPVFGQRIDHHREKLKRQQDKQLKTAATTEQTSGRNCAGRAKQTFVEPRSQHAR